MNEIFAASREPHRRIAEIQSEKVCLLLGDQSSIDYLSIVKLSLFHLIPSITDSMVPNERMKEE